MADDCLKPYCMDCGIPYQDFPLDMTLPDEQWLMIHPEGEGGLLCAGCIVKRAARLPGVIAVRAIFEFVEISERRNENGYQYDPTAPKSRAG